MAPAIMRVAESYCSPVQTTSSRENSVSRTSTSFIPSEFDFTVGRLGDSRLGSHQLGGGIVRGIATASSRELTLPRSSETYAEEIDTTADQTLTLPRTSDTFVEPIDTDTDRGFTGWAIGGRMVPEFVDEIRDWQRLTLVFRTPIDIVRDVLRPLDANAGSLSLVERADGSFKVTDRAGGSNTFDVEPPFGREDVRPVRVWHVGEYEDEVIDQDGERYEATLELTASESKSLQEQYDDIDQTEVASDEWLFDFNVGSFATRRVRHDIGKEGTDGVETTMLTLELEPRQVRILEENASKQAAVTIREVPDGSNFVSDAAAENTLSLTVPNNVGDGISSGDFAVMDWETEWLNDAFYEVSLEIASIV